MQDKKQERLHFDKFTIEEPWQTFTGRTYNKIIGLFLKLKPGKNDVIIDMGCGTGELTKETVTIELFRICEVVISQGLIEQ